MSKLEASQMAMARYLRNPEEEPPPERIEPRRLKIYEDLVYNNIESFLVGGFPLLHSLYGEADWRELVRGFMQQHRCRSPYFLEISQEFLQFLMEDHTPRECDPPFMAELAHYEWVEIALDVSQEKLPDCMPVDDLQRAIPHLSSLAWSLQYNYPVHKIGPDSAASAKAEPTFLLVYRTREDQVQFMEVNGATSRMLELIRSNESASVAELLSQLASELGVEMDAVLDFGCQQIEELADQSIVWLTAGNNPAAA
jgi:hypothetical protein